jgi:hypothetical protein
MTLPRWFLIGFCIVFAKGSYAQESATSLPDAPKMQQPAVRAAGSGETTPNAMQPPLDGRKARLALMSQVSSKSPSGSSFMAKLEDPVEVDGNPCCPRGPWWKVTWRPLRRAV